MKRAIPILLIATITLAIVALMPSFASAEENPDIVTHFTDSGTNIIVAPAGVLRILEYNEQIQAPAGPRRVSKSMYRAMVYRSKPSAQAMNTAKALVREIKQRYPSYEVDIDTGQGAAYIRVLVGYFESQADANALAQKLSNQFGKANFASSVKRTRTVLIKSADVE